MKPVWAIVSTLCSTVCFLYASLEVKSDTQKVTCPVGVVNMMHIMQNIHKNYDILLHSLKALNVGM